MRIVIQDQLPPEANAMLQALYSRSSQSVDRHLERVQERGPDSFMSSYYVGYGHASIGDCGYTTLFIEDISLLACKAVQDNPLYSGQETSTRYIDFSTRALVDPVGTSESAAILDRWMAFYRNGEPVVRQHLLDTLDRPPAQSDTSWRKAIAARCFDILRGFLPSAVTSQVAWTTNLRQASEHGLRLRTHPLSEVRAIGESCLSALRARYPSSFGADPRSDDLAYLQKVASAETYARPTTTDLRSSYMSTIDNGLLEAECLDLISTRPRKQTLPKSLSRYGVYQCRTLLDFGSFRDLQRHRGGHCRMPLLTDRYGMHPWYLEQLPDQLRPEADRLIREQAGHIDKLRRTGVSEEDIQYFQPIGMKVLCELFYDLPQMVYVAELRSGKTVHPTLRKVAQEMGDALHEQHPNLQLFIDYSADEFSARRGDQDIVDLDARRSAA